MYKLILIILLILINSAFADKTDKRPDILLIAVDDLNDWIGCLNGHPQAITPNMDRLAKRGVLFSNAHCQAPVCNPSRASMMTGLYPSTSGIYFLNPSIGQSPEAKKSTVMPIRFQNDGYHVTGGGKIFHSNQGKKYLPNWQGNFGGFNPLPDKKLTSFKGVRLWDWGIFPEKDEEMPDHKIANWAQSVINQKYEKPHFLAVGFYQPHVPQYAPQKWFDLYPEETLQLPKTIKNDLDDVPQYGINLTRLSHVAPTHDWVTESNEWKPLVRSYLACTTFVDAQIGKVLDALDKNGKADNTIIVLYSDHGFHLGEKNRWAKRSLWEDSTRVPMIITGPGIAQGKVCKKPVQLLDIYPTLLELTGAKADPRQEGKSLVKLLHNTEHEWPHMARTSFGPGNYSLRSERFRYIHYNDGSEEFYDHSKDPHEWHNQINNPEFKEIIESHRVKLPIKKHPILGTGSTGHRAYNRSEETNAK